MEVNRQYKDRLFRLLFGREEYKANILSLYNALRGTDYTDEALIELTTIDDVLYIGMKNDVSFIIDTFMPLWEQQSTYNPNMPVRGFMYYGKLYGSFIARSMLSLYSSTIIKLPTPQYIVLYNGDTERPAVEKMKLSDAFFDGSVNAEYEWTATVFNLNDKSNDSLLDKCKPLSDYMAVVSRIKEKWVHGMTDNEAVKAVDEAIKSCIDDGILVEFLTKHRAEVIDVCLTEFDEKKYADTLRSEGKAEGLSEGIEQGIDLGVDQEQRHVITALLEKGSTTEQIHELLNYPPELIEKIRKEQFD